MNKPGYILPIIVIAQFLCTSLWFAGNAIIPDLAKEFELTHAASGHITSAIQFGFIIGTLSYALSNITDRYSPSKLFFVSAIAAAAFNLAIVVPGQSISSLLSLRFFTGFFLAGVYPVGMKIAADYYDKGLGTALGFLVGALVIGTSFPHLLKSFTVSLPWKVILYITSALAITGSMLIRILVADGPYRKSGQRLQLNGITTSFQNKDLRTAATGYFGHMWELYTFWAFVPVMLSTYVSFHPQQRVNIPVYSFLVIASGGIACVVGGFIAKKYGAVNTAFGSLLLSCCCCLVSPLAFNWPFIPFITFLIFWGSVVIADSPLFSGLVAKNAAAASKGTILTLVTCIGFTITIVSIELISSLQTHIDSRYIYQLLAPGPLIGLMYMYFSQRRSRDKGDSNKFKISELQ